MKNVLDELLQARIPAEYVKAAVLQREVLEGMLARLEGIILQPQIIVDVGCAMDGAPALLKKRYPDADIVAMDSSLADHSVDLVTASLVLPWCDELQPVLQEWRRILRPDGLLMLTSLGPDTLRELHDLPFAFPHFMDMHTVGDLLTQVGFRGPVLDVDYFTLAYEDIKKCWHELQVTGMIAGNVDGVQLEKTEENYAVSYEIIFGHAWGSDLIRADSNGEVRIPISRLR